MATRIKYFRNCYNKAHKNLEPGDGLENRDICKERDPKVRWFEIIPGTVLKIVKETNLSKRIGDIAASFFQAHSNGTRWLENYQPKKIDMQNVTFREHSLKCVSI